MENQCALCESKRSFLRAAFGGDHSIDVCVCYRDLPTKSTKLRVPDLLAPLVYHASLGFNTREALRGYLFDGWSVQVIAKTQGISVADVRANIENGLRVIFDLL